MDLCWHALVAGFATVLVFAVVVGSMVAAVDLNRFAIVTDSAVEFECYSMMSWLMIDSGDFLGTVAILNSMTVAKRDKRE